MGFPVIKDCHHLWEWTNHTVDAASCNVELQQKDAFQFSLYVYSPLTKEEIILGPLPSFAHTVQAPRTTTAFVLWGVQGLPPSVDLCPRGGGVLPLSLPRWPIEYSNHT